MKRGYTYTIVFIFIISSIFAGLLAGINAVYSKKIKENEEIVKKISILYVLNITVDGKDANEIFNEKIKVKELGDMTYYSTENIDGKEENYAVPFEGPGLWGAIKGYLGVDSDFSTIIGVVFTEQNETPGLGGRIDEEWYKEQFRGLTIENKTITYGEEMELDAITGATLTSNAVLKILNKLVENILIELEEIDEK